MNNTININLGGFFFHIDEIAYKKLKRYLDSISNSLGDNSQGKSEIIADIEARISELLSEKITDSRQVVNEGDIDNIIKIMGQPEDYVEAEESYKNSSRSYKRNSYNAKKLFRDGEDKFLGGVASGIAHYLSVDVIWIRLSLLALLFGGGFGVVIYIILWILLPEAKTTAEKLQMEGEPVNINNIEKKIREEFSNVSENVKNVANQTSEKIKKTFSNKTKRNNGLEDFIDVVGKIFTLLFKIIAKFIGVIIIITAATVILALIISGFSIGSFDWLNADGGFYQYPHFFYGAILPRWLLTLSLFLLIGIPFIILLVLGLKILSSSVRQFSKATSLTFLSVWLLALLSLIFTGIDYVASNSSHGQYVNKIPLNYVKNDTILLKMRNDETFYYSDNLRSDSNKRQVQINGVNKVYSNYVKVNVKKSNSKKGYIIIRKHSKGKSRINANNNAKKIDYKYKINDNKIILNAYYLSDCNNIWKDEKINITFYLPKDLTIYFDSSVKNFLDNYNNSIANFDKIMTNKYYTMTQDGLYYERIKPLNKNKTNKI